MDMDKPHEGRDNRADLQNRGDKVQDVRVDQDGQINEVHDLVNAVDVDPRSLDGDALPGLVDHLQQVVRNLEHCLQQKDEQAAHADLFTDHVMEQNRMMSLCLAKMQKSMMDYAMEIEKECSAYQVSCSASQKSCDELQDLVVTLVEEVKTLNKVSELRKQAYLQVVSKLCKRSEIFVEILEVVDKIKEGRGQWEKEKRSFVMYFRKTLERFRSLGRESLTKKLRGFLDDVILNAEECMYSDDLHSGLSGRVKNASRYSDEVDREVWDQVEDKMRCEKEKLVATASNFEDRVRSACDRPGLLTDLLDLMTLRKTLLDDVSLTNSEGTGDKAAFENKGEVSYFTEDGCRVAFTVLDEALSECCALVSQNVDDSTIMAPNEDEQREYRIHVEYTSQGGENELQRINELDENSLQEQEREYEVHVEYPSQGGENELQRINELDENSLQEQEREYEAHVEYPSQGGENELQRINELDENSLQEQEREYEVHVEYPSQGGENELQRINELDENSLQEQEREYEVHVEYPSQGGENEQQRINGLDENSLQEQEREYEVHVEYPSQGGENELQRINGLDENSLQEQKREYEVHVEYPSQGGENEQQRINGLDENSLQEQLSVDSLEIDEGMVCTGQIHESKDEDVQDSNDPKIGQTASQGSFADTNQGGHEVDVARRSSSGTSFEVDSLENEVKSDMIENTSNGSVPDGKPPVYTKRPDRDDAQDQISSETREKLLLPNECECDPQKTQGKFISQAIVGTIKDMFQFGESISSLPKFTPRTCPSSPMSLASNDSLFIGSLNSPQTGGKFGTYLRGSSLDNGLLAVGSSCNKMSERGWPQRREIGRSKSAASTIRRLMSRSPIKNVSGEDSVLVRNLSTNSVPLKRAEGKMAYLYQSAMSVDSLDSFHGINVREPGGRAAVSKSTAPKKSSEMGEIKVCSGVNREALLTNVSVDLKPSADWSELVRKTSSVPVCLSETSYIELSTSVKCPSSVDKSEATLSHSDTEELHQTFAVMSSTDSSINLPLIYSIDSADSLTKCGQMETIATSDSLVTKDRPNSENAQPQQRDVQCQTLTCPKQQDRVQVLQHSPELNKCLMTDTCEMVSPTDLSHDCIETSTPDDKNSSGKVDDAVSCRTEEGSVGCSTSINFSDCSSDITSLPGMSGRTTPGKSSLMEEEKDSNENVLNVHHDSDLIRASANSPDLEITNATFTVETTPGGKTRKRVKSKEQKCLPNKKEKNKENEKGAHAEDHKPEGVLKGVAVKKKKGKGIKAHPQKNQSPRTPVYRLKERNFHGHLGRQYMTPSPPIKKETLSGHQSGTELSSASPKPVSTPRNTRRANRRFLEVKGSAQVLPALSRTPTKNRTISRPPVRNILAQRQGYSTESEASSASQGECLLPSATEGGRLLLEEGQQKAGRNRAEVPKEGEVGKSHFADVQTHANQGKISRNKCLLDGEGHMLEVIVGGRTSNKKADIVHETETSKLTTKQGDQFGSRREAKQKQDIVTTITQKVAGKTGSITGEGMSTLKTTDAEDNAKKLDRKFGRAVESVGEIVESNSQTEKATDDDVELGGILDNSEKEMADVATNDQGPVGQNLQGEIKNSEADVKFSGKVDEQQDPKEHQEKKLERADEVDRNLTKAVTSQKTDGDDGMTPKDAGLICCRSGWSELVDTSAEKEEKKVPEKETQPVLAEKNGLCKTEKDGPSEEGPADGLQGQMLTGNPSPKVQCDADSMQAAHRQGRYSLREDVLSVLPISTHLEQESSPSKTTACKDKVLRDGSKSSKYYFPKSSKNMKKKECLEVVPCASNGQNCGQEDVAGDLKERDIQGVAAAGKGSADGASEGRAPGRREPSQDRNDDMFRKGGIVQLESDSPTKNPDQIYGKNRDKRPSKNEARRNACEHVQTHTKEESSAGARTCLSSVSLKGIFGSSDSRVEGILNEGPRREFERSKDKGICAVSELKPVSKIKTTNSFEYIVPKGFKLKTSRGTRFTSRSKGRRNQTSSGCLSWLSGVNEMPGQADKTTASERTSTTMKMPLDRLPLDEGSSYRRYDVQHRDVLTEGATACTHSPVGRTPPKRIPNKDSLSRRIPFPQIPDSKMKTVKASQPASPKFCYQKSPLPRLPNIASSTQGKNESKKKLHPLNEV